MLRVIIFVWIFFKLVVFVNFFVIFFVIFVFELYRIRSERLLVLIIEGVFWICCLILLFFSLFFVGVRIVGWLIVCFWGRILILKLLGFSVNVCFMFSW